MRNRLTSSRRGAGWILWMLSAAAVWLVGAAVPAAAQTTVDRAVTFTKDVAPILQKSCQQCHRPDSIAPMSLITYEQTRPYARAIKQRTQLVYVPGMRGVMPPWFLEPYIGVQHIKDDKRLTDEEIAILAKWADSGAPQGNPADMPPPLVFADNSRWFLGKPDLITSSPRVTVQPLQPDWWGLLDETPSDLPEDRYAASAEYKETSDLNPSSLPRAGEDGMGKVGIFVFHHNFLSIRRPMPVKDGDEEDSDVATLPAYSIGRDHDQFNTEVGKLIPARAIFGWDVHLHAPGVPTAGVRTAFLSVGFKFHPTGWKPKYVERQMGGQGGQGNDLDIRSDRDRNRYDSYWVAPQHIKVLNFDPHMHAAGIRMCLEAVAPSITETLSCAGYDHNWVRNYDYDENWYPLLPKGTILHNIGWFDGTAKNANNLDARNTTLWGRRTVQNMFSQNTKTIFMTDEEYEAELAKRREYLTRTNNWDKIVGCPDCFLEAGAATKPRPARRPDADAGQ